MKPQKILNADNLTDARIAKKSRERFGDFDTLQHRTIAACEVAEEASDVIGWSRLLKPIDKLQKKCLDNIRMHARMTFYYLSKGWPDGVKEAFRIAEIGADGKGTCIETILFVLHVHSTKEELEKAIEKIRATWEEAQLDHNKDFSKRYMETMKGITDAMPSAEEFAQGLTERTKRMSSDDEE